MGATLRWYILKDLFRIFFLTSGALTGIMSFGGMLKPLYEVGLSVSQVAKILIYSGPAMTAYSLPIAALFATTIVYGRLGADNEITACRAAGISHLWMTLPAFVLGIVTAFISIAALCFVVPASMLKVEKTIFSNLADIVAGQIERKHQIQFDQSGHLVTVFAKSAQVLPMDPAHPERQSVRLEGPVITMYEPRDKLSRPLIPREFYMASSALTQLTQDPDHSDDVSMKTYLQNATNFPRNIAVAGAPRVSIGEFVVGPVPVITPVRENTKFMDIFRLRTMIVQPEQSRTISRRLREFIRKDQQHQYLQQLSLALTDSASQSITFTQGEETMKLTRASTMPVQLEDDRLIIPTSPGEQPLKFVQTHAGRVVAQVDAEEGRIVALPDTPKESREQQIQVSIDLYKCMVDTGSGPVATKSFSRSLVVPMPAPIASVTTRPAREYISGPLKASQRQELTHDVYKLVNSAISEIYARLSFAVSCLILVMVGCALGMMFRSGNFLSAFAISVVPALLSIALVVTGQHTCENVPFPVPEHWSNPLNFGLIIIWSGNVAVMAIAAALLAKLQRE